MTEPERLMHMRFVPFLPREKKAGAVDGQPAVPEILPKKPEPQDASQKKLFDDPYHEVEQTYHPPC